MIRVTGISKTFYAMPVLNKIDFAAEKSERHVVLGQSGSGKSTFLKILAGLSKPDEGTLKLDSPNLGMLFQKNALFDSMTVYENLNFTLKERTRLNETQRREKITHFLEAVGLGHATLLFPDSLSGGMQKRLGIARALIVEPEILFLDEPTAGLDPITSRSITSLIETLSNKQNTTIVMVTSDVLRAYQLAHCLWLFVRSTNGAHLLKLGSPNEARALKDPLVEQFLKGETQGPLTGENALALERRFIDSLKHNTSFGAKLTERFDVDFF